MAHKYSTDTDVETMSDGASRSSASTSTRRQALGTLAVSFAAPLLSSACAKAPQVEARHGSPASDPAATGSSLRPQVSPYVTEFEPISSARALYSRVDPNTGEAIPPSDPGQILKHRARRTSQAHWPYRTQDGFAAWQVATAQPRSFAEVRAALNRGFPREGLLLRTISPRLVGNASDADVARLIAERREAGRAFSPYGVPRSGARRTLAYAHQLSGPQTLEILKSYQKLLAERPRDLADEEWRMCRQLNDESLARFSGSQDPEAILRVILDVLPPDPYAVDAYIDRGPDGPNWVREMYGGDPAS